MRVKIGPAWVGLNIKTTTKNMEGKMKLNNKGYFPFPILFDGLTGAIAGGFIGACTLLAVVAGALTPSHRIIKAEKKCVHYNAFRSFVAQHTAEEPTEPTAGMWWFDAVTDTLRQRTSDNTKWKDIAGKGEGERWVLLGEAGDLPDMNILAKEIPDFAESCHEIILSMTAGERLAYIKDTQESPSSVWDK